MHWVDGGPHLQTTTTNLYLAHHAVAVDCSSELVSPCAVPRFLRRTLGTAAGTCGMLHNYVMLLCYIAGGCSADGGPVSHDDTSFMVLEQFTRNFPGVLSLHQLAPKEFELCRTIAHQTLGKAPRWHVTCDGCSA
jgi:hypothetical protein